MSIVTQQKRNPFTDQSLWFLLISNIVAIYFATTQGWAVSTLMMIYWFQSVTIGLFNFIRILQLKDFSTDNFKINGRQPEATPQTKVSTAFFFLFHYGIFHLVYLVFILEKTIPEADLNYLYLTVAAFFISHAFSYFYNKPFENQKPNIGTLMFYPYARILPMHLTLGLAGALPYFLILKVVADVVMHSVEHNIFRKS